MKKLALVILLSIPLAGCGEKDATHAVESMGFIDVTLTGTPLYGCGDSDSVFYNYKFRATSVNGKPVSGIACGSIFKAYTVRIY